MGRKRSFESVRDYINGDDGNGCVLLTTKDEYVDTQEYLKVQCKCKEVFSVKFKAFLAEDKRQCNECGALKGRQKHFDRLKNFINIESNSGCTLITKEITDCKSPIEIECACHNPFTTTFDSFKNKNVRQCEECTKKKNRLSFEDIKEYFKTNNINYILLDMERRVNRSGRSIIYVNVWCKNKKHPAYWISYNSFKSGRRCKICHDENKLGKALKWTREQILKLLEKNNLTLIDETQKLYSKKKIPCINSDGYKVNVSVNTLSQGSIPSIFKGNKFALENLQLLCSKYNYKLLDNQTWKRINNRYDAITEDEYYVQVIPYLLLNGQGTSIFGKNKKHLFNNLIHYCKINRPDYIPIDINMKGNKHKSTFKYIGNKVDMTDKQRYFQVSVERFLYGDAGHPSLAFSRGERIIESWLLSHHINYRTQWKFEGCFYKRQLKFDFAIFDDKDNLKCVIEFQGIQHYQSVDYFGGEEQFKINKIRDMIKKSYCQNNNIKLIEISYNQINDIDNILYNLVINDLKIA